MSKAPTRAELAEGLRRFVMLYSDDNDCEFDHNDVSLFLELAEDLLRRYDEHPEQPAIGDRRALSPGKTDTSSAAARTLKPHLTELHQKVLRALCAYPEGANAHVISTRAGVPYRNAQPRITELVQLGFVVDSGRRAPNARGNTTTVWIPTRKGHDYVSRHPL